MKKYLTYGLAAMCILIIACNNNPTGEDDTDYTWPTAGQTNDNLKIRRLL